ncbi:hypothetical protein CGLO_17550 [Colletotrichum gloeosporioides Cg-14]|uniref:Uncharacterized protein n=1 Tax=Colletotrichum gloeosporioides (strain Cg-14) TaxID=1237896 RepID=T0JTE9_COLGC|nr:hypothetical protein CGLO_17550 [Colletotrichum gloeosporioides Cg-14]
MTSSFTFAARLISARPRSSAYRLFTNA